MLDVLVVIVVNLIISAIWGVSFTYTLQKTRQGSDPLSRISATTRLRIEMVIVVLVAAFTSSRRILDLVHNPGIWGYVISICVPVLTSCGFALTVMLRVGPRGRAALK